MSHLLAAAQSNNWELSELSASLMLPLVATVSCRLAKPAVNTVSVQTRSRVVFAAKRNGTEGVNC